MAYKLTHPDSDLTVEVNADRLETYISQGWETSPNANPPEADEKPKGK